MSCLYRKCSKCGITATKENGLRFHCFPKPGKTNIVHATAWATFCWPEQKLWSLESLNKLHSSHKMLCKTHFEDSCFTDGSKSRLSKFAVPGDRQYVIQLLTKLRRELRNNSSEKNEGARSTSHLVGNPNAARCQNPGRDHVQLTEEHNYFKPFSDPPTNNEDVNSDAGVTLDEFEEPPIEAVFSWQKDDIINPTEDTDVPMCSGVNRGELEQELGDVSLYDEPDAPRDADSGKQAEYRCNVCEKEIKGFRYTCVQCADWDLCGACEARELHAAHYVLRVPSPRPYNEIQAVLAAIRQQLLSENLFLPEQIIEDGLKTEAEDPCDAEPAPAPDPLQPPAASEDEHTDGSEYRPSRHKRRRRSSDSSDTSQADSVPDSDIYDAQDVKTYEQDNLASDKRNPSERPTTHHRIEHSRRKPLTRRVIHPIKHINVDYHTEEVLHSSQQPVISHSKKNDQSVLKLAGTIYGVPVKTIKDPDALLEIPDNMTVLIQDTPNSVDRSDSLNINRLDTGNEVVVSSNLEDHSEILHIRVPPDTNKAALAQALHSQAYVVMQPLAIKWVIAKKKRKNGGTT